MGLKNWGFRGLCLLPLVPALLLPGLGVLGSLAVVVFTLVFVAQARAPTLSLSGGYPVREILQGLGFGVIVALASHLLIEPIVEQWTGKTIDLGDLGDIEGNLPSFLVLLALGVLFGGIIEELIFRGFVVGWGSRVFGDGAGVWLVALSAGVFGLSHLYQSLPGVITTGLLGLIFGLLYLWNKRRLLVPIVTHMTVNTYSLTLMYLGLY
ncbi:CPBP family intramembrane metalloprotease [Tsuneonella sp. YG55]|uniref:CPBP family intramembrane metalloprotease n=1 Tax=Tsuneonella litorea TaxID=2976475 RepID=A0A9X2W1D2_9SPHN|nr:CPBP family intramembrane glutamic endopeptidase [Tsuneonella litorea]MCT2559011.1 CPBP family intramembrane metalloprotease [Tsuneonella litorea]